MSRRRSQSPKTLDDLFYTDVIHAEDTEWFKARPDRNFRAHVWIGAKVKGKLRYGRVLIDKVPRPLKPGNLPTDLTMDMVPEGTTPRLLGLTFVRRIQGPTLHPYTVIHPDPAVVMKDVVQLIQARDEEAYLYEYWTALDKDARARAG